MATMTDIHMIKAVQGLKMRRGRFYLDRKRMLVKIISDEMQPFPVFAALKIRPVSPKSKVLDIKTPDLDNVVLARLPRKGEKDTAMNAYWSDLVRDVTCWRCEGMERYSPCPKCKGKGFDLGRR